TLGSKVFPATLSEEQDNVFPVKRPDVTELGSKWHGAFLSIHLRHRLFNELSLVRCRQRPRHAQNVSQFIQVVGWFGAAVSRFILKEPLEGHNTAETVLCCPNCLGTLSLQHAVCLLPLTEQHQPAYARLAWRVEEYGGEATVLETHSPDDAWHAKIVARFNAARDEEYEEVLADAPLDWLTARFVVEARE